MGDSGNFVKFNCRSIPARRAHAVMIGRPHLWGVACAGEDGVFWALELFRREIDRALALGGWDGVAKLDRSIFFRADPGDQLSSRVPSASSR
jgi:hypothetical protein